MPYSLYGGNDHGESIRQKFTVTWSKYSLAFTKKERKKIPPSRCTPGGLTYVFPVLHFQTFGKFGTSVKGARRTSPSTGVLFDKTETVIGYPFLRDVESTTTRSGR